MVEGSRTDTSVDTENESGFTLTRERDLEDRVKNRVKKSLA